VKPVAVMVVLAIFCCLAALAQSQTQAATPPASSGQAAAPPEQPKPVAEKQPPEELARKYVELWNTGNFDLINSVFEFPVIMTSRGHRTRLDPAMLKRVINAWRYSMPDLNFKVEDTMVQGEKVAMRLVFTGTYKHLLFPNTIDPQAHKDPARGIRATAMWMFEIRDGKVRQIWEEYDEIRMHYEMGGFWRSNQELEAAAKASQPPPPTPEPEPSPAPPPKP